MTTHLHDAELIARLGGPSKVAELLDMKKKGSAQRVQNWLTRGIPAAVKIKHPAILMPELTQSTTNSGQPEVGNVAQGVANV